MDLTLLADALSGTAPDTASPVVNGEGSFAMRYYNPGQIMTRCNQHDYIFVTQANLCMSWVLEEHIGCILNKRGGCCGQSRPGVFTYATASDTRRWTNRGGR